MLLTSGLWGVLESSIFAQAFGVLEIPKGSYDLVLALAALPVVSFLAQLLIILALKFENAGTVSLMRTCDVIFAFTWQMIFLNVFPDDYSLIGAAIVIVGVIVITLRSMLSSLPPEDPRRRRFRFLLY
ncbi:unnamed protein product [Allacma fusca]|uniref:EamA domain-containing protein n=1 Tax=Allacma fusca TaxID=39272 RepID=A0A8J2JBX8_9HEXA|nr:unnamed protein product [Allacma fusca]